MIHICIARDHYDNYCIKNLCLLADVTEKTVSEEYTPLHLAARFMPPKRTHKTSRDEDGRSECESGDGTVEADGGGAGRQDSSEEVITYIKNRKGVDVRKRM